MEMRTRIFGKMLNSEVQDYLSRNDIIIVPVGTTEMHGGFPLDCETVIAEAYALKMAESCDGLVLTGLPYFYAGATSSGRGTVQMSIRNGIDYLTAIAHSLLRCGFKRQIYVSFHAPANLTITPMLRDFYDETGVSIAYLDCFSLSGKMGVRSERGAIHDITVGAYQIMNRLEDVPLVTGYDYKGPSSTAPLKDLFDLGCKVGYTYGENTDHLPTPDIPDVATRDRMAAKGVELISGMVERMDMPRIVEQLNTLAQYCDENAEKYPWIPAAWNKKR